MPRTIDAPNIAQLQAHDARMAFFLEITFRTETCYLSTLTGNYVWNGQTWAGTGAMGKISTIEEGVDLQSYGTSVSLSGLDPVLLPEAMGDIQIGAPAYLYQAFFDSAMNIIGSPVLIFAGQVDQPSIQVGGGTATISLNLESPMSRLQSGSYRKLTDADQRMNYPTDSAFVYVSVLNFQALRWGS
jgi:hypothetical protein